MAASGDDEEAPQTDLGSTLASPLPELGPRAPLPGSTGEDRSRAGSLPRLLGALSLRRCRFAWPLASFPRRFKLLLLLVMIFSAFWLGNYWFEVLPALSKNSDNYCRYTNNQLSYNAKMLFVYFLWFAIARTFLFFPCIARRVAFIQLRQPSFCRTYCVHLLVRDGPLYIFGIGSFFFWFHLMQSPSCETRSPLLYQTLKLYAIYSCTLAIVCLGLAYWHNRLMSEHIVDFVEPERSRAAPADTLAKLQTCAYNEGPCLQHHECAICLCAWEPDDLIKVTQCQHAFHEDCLGGWLRTARTCALCRQDLTVAPQAMSTRELSRESSSSSDVQVMTL